MSPFHEPYLVKESEIDLDNKFANLQSKMSETIPLLPEHKDLMQKKNRSDLHRMTELPYEAKSIKSLSRPKPKISMRTGKNSPFLEKIVGNKH